ncbi:hypothetical protein [Cryobacterium sp. CG_9.6]|uniref:hypothetical protein n=1 Tax=Cryobacterium sp. CG_9.6 TaxID=2760710 RepID=UPI002475F6B4|nr:hypothetical protein [Cryobacterium sp. CG_9.6]MDH6236378.1 hypothetical protein [Cryobacterium sp. CG_9.6]
MTDHTSDPGVVSESNTAASASRRRAPRWITLTLAIIFGLFYAYDVWEAVGNLVGVSLNAQSLDTTLNGLGWTVLIWGIVMPVLVFAAAFWLGRRRSIAVQVLLYLVGLATAAALALDLFVLFSVGGLIV